MVRNETEKRFLGELEIVQAHFQRALLDLNQTISFCAQMADNGTDADVLNAALYTARQNLTHAGDVYNMALLELTDY